MSADLPFPPELVAISGASAQAAHDRQKARVRMVRGRAQQPRPQEHVTTGLAAYRTERGDVQPAYDYYRPTFPRGAEPGIAKMHMTPRYSVNGHEGYDRVAVDFVPAREILRDIRAAFPDTDRSRTATLAVALVETGEGKAFLWARDEEQMEGWASVIPEDARIIRPILTLHGMREGQPPSCALMFRTSGVTECHVASDPDVLVAALARRIEHLPLAGKTLDEAIAVIAEKAEHFGWNVHAQSVTHAIAPHLQSGIGRNLSTLNEDAMRVCGVTATPREVLFRPTQKIEIAAIRGPEGAEPILVYGADENALNRHLANALRDVTDPDAPRFSSEDGDVRACVDAILAAHPQLSVARATGSADMGWGGEPDDLLLVTDISAGTRIGIGAVNESNLFSSALQAMGSRVDMGMVDDIYDIAYQLMEAGSFTVEMMSGSEREDRVTAMRAAMSDPALAPS